MVHTQAPEIQCRGSELTNVLVDSLQTDGYFVTQSSKYINFINEIIPTP